AAGRKAGNQGRRQAGGSHLALGCSDVVGDPVVGEAAAVCVESSVGGARVAVARLAGAAGVKDHPLDGQTERRAGTHLTAMRQFSLVLEETELKVRVAAKRIRCVEQTEVRRCRRL